MADEQTRLLACGAIARFFDSADLSDYTLTCQGTEWKVHRFLLSLHSSVLAKACNGDFKEAHQKRYDFSDHAKEQVDALVKYLYTFDYEPAGEAHAQHLSFHVNQAILADKYDIPGLNKLATDKFKAIINDTKQATELVDASKSAYGAERATRGICKCIAELVVTRESFSPGGKEGHVFEEIIGSFPNLAVEIIKVMKMDAPCPKEAIPIKRYKCPQADCGKIMTFAHSSNAIPMYTCPHCQLKNYSYRWIEA